jgi:hypothetical protein
VWVPFAAMMDVDVKLGQAFEGIAFGNRAMPSRLFFHFCLHAPPDASDNDSNYECASTCRHHTRPI